MFPLRDTIPSHRAPVCMYVLIALNGLVFLFQLGLSERDLRNLFYLFGIVPARFSHPDWAVAMGFPADDYWPFLTSMFLHGGWLHVLSNLYILYIFGDNVEDRMGPLRFLGFYLVCGIAAGVLHWWTNPSSTVPTIGASGAIAGVMGAYLRMFPHARVLTLVPIFFYPLFIEVPAFVFLLFWFWTQFFSGTLSLVAAQQAGGIAWWAHIGGFVAGLVLFRFFLRPVRQRREAVRGDGFAVLPPR